MGLAWMAIPLTQGLFALVDGEDYEELSKHKWYAIKKSQTFYAVRSQKLPTSKQELIEMHRIVLDIPKEFETDHRNGCGLDNRKTNLRPATHTQNCWNRSAGQNHSSKYKGVSWHKRDKKWHAVIQFNSKSQFLGCFDDEVDAALAYDKAAKELFGEFAYINF